MGNSYIWPMENFKLIHTADWHIGLALEKQPMMDEHEFFIDQLANIITQEQPDALLVSGDVFDTSNPANDVHNWLIGQLKRLHHCCPHMQLVLTAGNHDSANRLLIGHQLTSLINTHLVGRLELNDDRTANYAGQVIPLAGAGGSPKALLAAVPFVNRLSYPVLAGGDADYDQRKTAYYQGLSAHMAANNPSGLPLLLMAHLTVANNGDGNRDEVGNIECVGGDVLGDCWDYVALGHLHHPHHCDGHGGRVNYSGSPIAVSFDEDFTHSVAVVEFCGRNIVRQERLPLKPKHRLVTFPKQRGGEATFSTFADAMAQLADYDGEEDYVRLNIFSKGLPDDFRTQALEAAKGRNCKLLKINYKHESHNELAEKRTYDFDEFRSLDPFQLALRYLEDSNNQLTDLAKCKLKECVDASLEESRNN